MHTGKLRKYLPAILTVIDIGAVISTGYFSAKAGIAIKEIALDDTKSKEEKRKEIIKESIPACLSAGAAIGCTVASNILGYSNTNNAKTEMAAGYVLLQNAYNSYRKNIDEETNARVLKKISEEKVREVIVPVYTEGKYAWCDQYHEEPWYATEGDVFWAGVKFKELFRNRCYGSLHDFYEILRKERGIDIPYAPMEEELVWDMDVLLYEWDTDEICFSALYDEPEKGVRFYTFYFHISPYPKSEVERIIKEIS